MQGMYTFLNTGILASAIGWGGVPGTHRMEVDSIVLSRQRP